ncbi:hypothetical protein DFJ43DRAFT_1069200 [Lentinula guzmanii]|uniref:Uncharacterized protein n=1 Tax=Lentinula guzmanii TaxID=2804957 RepID=A0AA38N2H0_9AGAR|nr:hypothetical protein DFJ43DRAFT_1069200 [Lentinula guzmanii]
MGTWLMHQHSESPPSELITGIMVPVERPSFRILMSSKIMYTARNSSFRSQFICSNVPNRMSSIAHIGVVVCKTISKEFYGESHTKTYFLVCSTGGRQGLNSIRLGIFPISQSIQHRYMERRLVAVQVKNWEAYYLA